MCILFAMRKARDAAILPREKGGHGGWADWPGWPYVLVGLAVVLRLLHIWNSRANPTFWAPAVDPLWYDEAAMRITQGDWSPFPLFRAPVYPSLLAAVYSIFGHDLLAARVLNVVLQGLTVWMLWWIGRSYFSATVGVIAAALFAVNGMTIYFAAEMVSTSVEMLAAVLCAWTTFRLWRDQTWAALAVCGLTYGLAAITRPNFLFVFPVALIALWFLPPKPVVGVRGITSRAVIWLFAALIPILPITAVNIVKGGEFVLIATQGGVNFWIGNNPESSGAVAVLPGYGNTWELEDARIEAEKELGRHLKPGELSNYYYQKGWKFIANDPATAIRLMIRKAALFFNRYEISNNKHIQYFSSLSPWLPWLVYLNFIVLIPLGTLGILVLWRRPEVKLLLALILVYAVSVILFFITARFRMPAVPWICWLAAGGIVWHIQSIRERASIRRFTPVLVLIPALVLTAIDVWGFRQSPVEWARFMEGNAHLRQNQLDSARVAYRDALVLGHSPATVYLNLGVLATRENHPAEAVEWYELALHYDSTYWKVWNNLGTVRDSQGDTSGAIYAYKRAIALYPLAGDARENLAGTYFRIGVRALKAERDSLAIAYLDSSTALHPDPAAYYNRALAFLRLGLNDKAMTSLNQSLALDPELPGALRLNELLRSGTSPPIDSALP